jgi:hypothetical protein
MNFLNFSELLKCLSNQYKKIYLWFVTIEFDT